MFNIIEENEKYLVVEISTKNIIAECDDKKIARKIGRKMTSSVFQGYTPKFFVSPPLKFFSKSS